MLAGLDGERAMAAGATPAWLASLEMTWSPVCRVLHGTDPASVSYETIERYVIVRREEGVKGQTIRREVQALRRGLTIAERRGWIMAVPKAPTIKSSPKDERRRGKLHPPDVLRRWLDAMPEAARDHAMFAAMTGLRAAEIARVRAEWVSPAPRGSNTRAVLRVPAEAAKSRTDRVVGLPDVAVEIVKRRVATHHDEPLVFGDVSYRRARREACAAIEYPKTITLRDLRHTYATLSLARTGDPWATMQALGHADLRTTSIYQSTTTERATAVAAAVADALTGAPKPEQCQGLVGAHGFEPWAPSSQMECGAAIEHVSECSACLDLIADTLWMQLETRRHRSTVRSSA